MEKALYAAPLPLDARRIERRLEELGERLVAEALGDEARSNGEPVWVSPAALVREVYPLLGWN